MADFQDIMYSRLPENFKYEKIKLNFYLFSFIFFLVSNKVILH
jgi:hypothetical protein